MRIRSPMAACLVLAATAARAETVEVSSTTLLNVGQQTRGGVPGEKPELVTVAPAYEILSIAARDVVNPVADDLQLVLNTWGSYDFRTVRWDAGTDGRLNADIVTGYLSGRLLKRTLTLRVGREHVAAGVGRMVQIDGGEAVFVVPIGLRLSAYVGSPVSQRFTTRTGIQSWNPMGGNLAYGGRAGWSMGFPGTPGRGVDVGVSINRVDDHGHTLRDEVAADFRLQPADLVTVSGFGAYSLFDGRYSEATVRVGWIASRRLELDADWRFVAPDLFIPRTSILSVFSDEQRNYFGGAATYRLRRDLLVGGAFHLQLEPGKTAESSKFVGEEAEARIEWERGETLAGLEAFFVHSFDNGYVAGRVFGRRELGRYFAALDLLLHRFENEVNGEHTAATGTLTAGVNLAKGFSAVVSGRAGWTPFLQQTYDIMAKLVYNQTYRMREVVR